MTARAWQWSRPITRRGRLKMRLQAQVPRVDRWLWARPCDVTLGPLHCRRAGPHRIHLDPNLPGPSKGIATWREDRWRP